jgi:hypothetical protein
LASGDEVRQYFDSGDSEGVPLTWKQAEETSQTLQSWRRAMPASREEFKSVTATEYGEQQPSPKTGMIAGEDYRRRMVELTDADKENDQAIR